MGPLEREAWTAVEAINDAWTQGRVADLERWFHPDMVAITPTDPGRLEGRAACLASWARFAGSATIHSWAARDPRVRRYGDTAVVAYGYEVDCTVDGRRRTLVGRDLFVLVRHEGRWLAVADHFSGEPGRAG